MPSKSQNGNKAKQEPIVSQEGNQASINELKERLSNKIKEAQKKSASKNPDKVRKSIQKDKKKKDYTNG